MCADLGDELQVVDVVLLGDDQLVDVSLPLPLHGTQHVEQVEVGAPWNTDIKHTDGDRCQSNTRENSVKHLFKCITSCIHTWLFSVNLMYRMYLYECSLS